MYIEILTSTCNIEAYHVQHPSPLGKGGGNQPPYRSIICYISFILCSVVLILTRFKQLGISRL